MPKPRLKPKYQQLETEILDTMEKGLKEWRPDLHYPESRSDMQGCIRPVLRMFEIKRRPIALDRSAIVHPDEACNNEGCCR